MNLFALVLVVHHPYSSRWHAYVRVRRGGIFVDTLGGVRMADMNRAERRAARKGKNPNAQERQGGGPPEQQKGNGQNQVVGPRKLSGKRGNR